MKKILGLYLLLISVCVCAAPTTTVKVTHPTTVAVRNPPRTNVKAERPSTEVKVEHPQTTVVVTHPTTPAPVKATDKGTSQGPEGTKGAAGSYTPSYKNAKSLGGNKGGDNVPKAAKLTQGESGLGQMSGAEDSSRSAEAAKDNAHKQELNQKEQQMIEKAMGNMKGMGGKIDNIIKNLK